LRARAVKLIVTKRGGRGKRVADIDCDVAVEGSKTKAIKHSPIESRRYPTWFEGIKINQVGFKSANRNPSHA
jgi:hypothetical protein